MICRLQDAQSKSDTLKFRIAFALRLRVMIVTDYAKRLPVFVLGLFHCKLFAAIYILILSINRANFNINNLIFFIYLF